MKIRCLEKNAHTSFRLLLLFFQPRQLVQLHHLLGSEMRHEQEKRQREPEHASRQETLMWASFSQSQQVFDFPSLATTSSTHAKNGLLGFLIPKNDPVTDFGPFDTLGDDEGLAVGLALAIGELFEY